MGWSLDKACQNYPAALEFELLMLDMLRIFVLVAGANELVPVALRLVVEDFSCSELDVMMLMFQ